MQLEFTEQQTQLKAELRQYFEDFMTEELKAELFDPSRREGGGPRWREGLRKLGRDGWIGLGWPKAFGGQQRSAIDQYIFTEEVQRAGFPYPFLTTESVGPTIARFASEEMKVDIIPRILAGEVNICIGYSEPGAGTDLASLKTRAERDGDEYVINGQKIFTSLAESSDYVWLAARTDNHPDTPKHKGISMFLIPFDTPGISFTPIYTLGGVRTNTTYYENVRIPVSMRVGEENTGWKMITSQLNRERLALVTHGALCKLFTSVCQWCRDTHLPNGERVIDQAWVQSRLAQVQVHAEALKLLCYKQAWAIDQDNLNMADASAAKVYGSEMFIEAYRALMEVIGEGSLLSRASQKAVLDGHLEQMYRVASVLTFGGGTNEIQRDIISAAGLMIPRASR
ncbi:acyl-CoA dehydrogenase [Pseudomaricurvus alkylphenolicus]|uniref:acyl-CoA dehydrogenase family protein n=1 Tax=Pseudomaricurvus alkylphenolicus TaxID=1306991 RepID=UPI00141EFA5D|nr:acyl-CoA dehydrogenase family protein [Pseudomaricurvus alkylphenolicus]NIB42134.1 acyl-CoA dehydrogenase [Pseudomaricurvus alkylphenolicus]